MIPGEPASKADTLFSTASPWASWGVFRVAFNIVLMDLNGFTATWCAHLPIRLGLHRPHVRNSPHFPALGPHPSPLSSEHTAKGHLCRSQQPRSLISFRRPSISS